MLHTKVDLNLFSVLVAIYEEGTTTAAAARLHLTQPAVSHALSRLRDKFNDELFTRHGRKMVPSAYCQTIIPNVITALELLDLTVDNQIEFDISQYKREIKIGFRDILESLFFPYLITDLATNTPNITIDSRQVRLSEIENALEQQSLDIAVDVLVPMNKNIHSTLMCNEHFSLVCRTNHPILQQLTLKSYSEASHAIVSLKNSDVDIIDMALAKCGVTRNVTLRCESYFAAVNVISQCDLLLTIPSAYANKLKDIIPIAVSSLPFAVPDLPVHIYWHKQVEQDPINSWMRDKLLHIASQLFKV